MESLPSHIAGRAPAAIPGASVPPWILYTTAGPGSNLQAYALQQLMQSLGLGPLALALSATGTGGPRSLLRQHIHIDELERSQPAIEQAQPRAHRWLFNDLDHIPFLWEDRRAEWSRGEEKGIPLASMDSVLPWLSTASFTGTACQAQERPRHQPYLQFQRVMVVGTGSEVGVDSCSATEGPCVLGGRWFLSKAAGAWAGAAELTACRRGAGRRVTFVPRQLGQ